jgi:adenylate kinase family enzyme
MTPQTFIFFGRSGSGKGTQAQLLIDLLKLQDPDRKSLYIQTGQKGRDFAKQKNYSAGLIRDIINDGQLFPSFIPIWFWTEVFVDSIVTGDEHIFLDGLCRRPEEAPILHGALGFYKRPKPFVVVINVSEKWAMERLSARGRADDVAKDIKNRLGWYERDVVPAINYFRAEPEYKILDINGEQTIEAVHQEILAKSGLKK